MILPVAVEINGILREQCDDSTRTYTARDETGAVTSTHPYTAEENAEADALIVSENLRLEKEETRKAIATILKEIDAEIKRAKDIKALDNSAIRTNPAPYINDLATAIIRLGQATKDLAKFTKDL